VQAGVWLKDIETEISAALWVHAAREEIYLLLLLVPGYCVTLEQFERAVSPTTVVGAFMSQLPYYYYYFLVPPGSIDPGG